MENAVDAFYSSLKHPPLPKDEITEHFTHMDVYKVAHAFNKINTIENIFEKVNYDHIWTTSRVSRTLRKCAEREASKTNKKYKKSKGEQLNEEEKKLAENYLKSKDITELKKEHYNSREKIILHNRRLIPKHVPTSLNHNNPAYADALQNGQIGLMRAVERFDVSTGNLFATYATWWIKQELHRGIHNNEKTIRIPIYLHEKIEKIKKTRRKLGLANTPITIDEISRQTGMSPIQIKKLEKITKPTLSIDTPINRHESDSESIAQLIPNNEPSPEDDLIKKERIQKIRLALDDLNVSDRDKTIFITRHGLENKESKTLKETGEEHGISRERVR